MDTESPSVAADGRLFARQEALFSTLIDNVLDGVVLVSPQNEVIYFNRHFIDLWRIPEELTEPEIGQAFNWAARQTLDPDGFIARVMALSADPNREPVREELPLKDGRTLDRFSAPILREGIHCGWIWTFRDITAQKKNEMTLRESEKQLRELSRDLEKRVLERTLALEEQAQRLRALTAELASAENRERKRLAALLHDDLQQLLVAATMRLNTVSNRIPQSREKDEIAQAADWIGKATTTARELAHELRPPSLYEKGLLPALLWLADLMQRRHGLTVTVVRNGEPVPLLDDWKALLFACVRELLFNVVKHANVTEAQISIDWEPGLLRIGVEDRGKGFDPAESAQKSSDGSFGLFSIHERMAGFGGKMTVQSAPGSGTRFELSLPISEQTSKTLA